MTTFFFLVVLEVFTWATLKISHVTLRLHYVKLEENFGLPVAVRFATVSTALPFRVPSGRDFETVISQTSLTVKAYQL